MQGPTPTETLAEKLSRLGEVVAKAVEATVPVAHTKALGEVVARVVERKWGV